MPNLLISGPAGGGKSAASRQARDAMPGAAVILDFQSIYSALSGDVRGPDGRYPVRDNPALLPITEFARQSLARAAREREIGVVMTNSDGAAKRRAYLLELLGPGAVERVIDPGREVVAARLAVDGALSPQCEAAIGRWYGSV